MKKISRITAFSGLLILYTLYAAAAAPPGSLSGKVVDAATHAGLTGATIYLPELKTGTVTRTGGSFRLQDIPAGSYLVEVRYVGYKTLAQTLTIHGEVHHDFSISAAVTEQDEVVVTGLSA